MYTAFTSGAPWLDTDGKRIQAHGGQIFQENGTYYWLGENKDHTTGEDEVWTWGVRLYSSNDLMNWQDEGLIVPPDLENRESILHPARHLDRPHLLFNEKTKKYVLWLKYCDDSHYAVLTADALKGPYTIVNGRYFPYGRKCGDFDLWKDEKGNAYIYFEADHTDLLGAHLSADYTQVEGEPVAIYSGKKPPETREAPTHFVRGGRHYLLTSGMTGYRPNPSEAAVSDDPLHGYTVLGGLSEGDPSNTTFHSQSTCVIEVNGKFLYLGDRWMPELNEWSYTGDPRPDPATQKKIMAKLKELGLDPVRDREEAMKVAIHMSEACNTSLADYVFLPLEWEGERPVLRWKDTWKL